VAREPNTLNILLVEDTEDDAFFFRLALKRTALACAVTHLADGRETVDFLKSTWADSSSEVRPDILFLDLKLPGLSGFDVLEWINRQPNGPALRVVILSGSDHSADINRARALGAKDYIVKPVSPDELKTLITATSTALEELSRPAAAFTR
jgi:CheY-like chemotaxis protein